MTQLKTATLFDGVRRLVTMARGRGDYRGGRFNVRSGNKGHTEGRRAPPREILTENEAYERYYNSLNLVPAGEKDAFWAALRRDLPNSFRFTGSKQQALAVRDHLEQTYGPKLKEITFEGEEVVPPQPISWYPEQLAYSMTIGKVVLRKNKPFKQFHTWLVSETTVGSISRQEVVSMIPPLMTDIKPGMTVLDMCAAPGSKTCQMIEMLHAGEEDHIKQAITQRSGLDAHTNGGSSSSEAGFEDDGRATGLLIANDKDWKRANMLIHQIKRLASPNVIIMNHDASLMPSIRLSGRTREDGRPQSSYLKFDRILADVPCSGDGTSRKNAHVWREWIPQNAIGLHAMQVRILVRAIQMLKVGGRVTYSTCSMNPVENEAVLLAAFAECGPHHLKMVNCSQHLPTLKRRNGLERWTVMDKSKRIWGSFGEIPVAEREDQTNAASRLTPNMFAPENPEPWQKDVIQQCMRVMAHQQDTGAFFIAVIEKTAEIKALQQVKKPVGAIDEEQPASIVDIAREMQSKPQNASGLQDHLKTLDSLHLPDDENDPGIRSAAEKQNSDPLYAKRKIDEEITQEPPAKKSRLEVDLLEAAGRKISSEEDHKGVETSDPAADLVAPINSATASAPINADDENPTTLDTTALPSADATHTNGSAVASHTVRPSSPPPFASNNKYDKAPYQEFFTFLPPNNPEILLIQEFYSLTPSFPLDRFYVRNPTGEPTKAIYYCSELARDILKSNNAGYTSERGGKASLRFVHAGVKMFSRQEAKNNPNSDSRWRIQSEGLPIIESYVSEERKIWCWRKSSFRALLKEMFVKFPDEGSDEDGLGEVGGQIKGMGFGCCVLKVGPKPEKFDDVKDEVGGDEVDGGENFVEQAVYPVWKGFNSLNLMMNKDDRKALLLREFGDTEAVKNSMVEKRDGVKAGDEAEEGIDTVDGVEEGTSGNGGADVKMEDDGDDIADPKMGEGGDGVKGRDVKMKEDS